MSVFLGHDPTVYAGVPRPLVYPFQPPPHAAAVYTHGLYEVALDVTTGGRPRGLGDMIEAVGSAAWTRMLATARQHRGSA